jgi:uncharacterized protein (TIGR00369 family)
MDGSSSVDSASWKPQPVHEGEWAGWGRYETDPFENLTGPFYARRDETGQMVCAVRLETKHMNAGGFLHGGCMAVFADYAIFQIAEQELEGSGSVTAQLQTECLDTAVAGDLLTATGEVTKAGRSLIFVRGLAKAGEKTVFSYSAIIKKVRR